MSNDISPQQLKIEEKRKKINEIFNQVTPSLPLAEKENHLFKSDHDF